jgi:hypothetical protein
MAASPPAGTGAVQTFQLTYADPPGFSSPNFGWAQMMVAAAPDGGGQPFCFLHYDRAANQMWLYGDGGFFIGPVTPGTVSNALQNAFCAIDTQHSSAVVGAAGLTLNAAVVFKASGARNVYMRTLNALAMDTGWVQKGTWTATAAPLETMTILPSSGSGSTQTFQLTYPAPSGFGGISFGWVQFLVAAASDGGGQPFCFLHYDRGGNGLWMYSSDVGTFVGPVAPGVASTTLSSSACSINTAGTTVNFVAGNLVLNVPVTMKAPMSGAKKTFMRTLDVLTRDTGWLQSGTWTIP